VVFSTDPHLVLGVPPCSHRYQSRLRIRTRSETDAHRLSHVHRKGAVPCEAFLLSLFSFQSIKSTTFLVLRSPLSPFPPHKPLLINISLFPHLNTQPIHSSFFHTPQSSAKMQSNLLALAAIFATALAAPSYEPCSDLLYSVPQCCSTDVLSVADLSCEIRMSFLALPLYLSPLLPPPLSRDTLTIYSQDKPHVS
jgi:hypothetical protein